MFALVTKRQRLLDQTQFPLTRLLTSLCLILCARPVLSHALPYTCPSSFACTCHFFSLGLFVFLKMFCNGVHFFTQFVRFLFCVVVCLFLLRVCLFPRKAGVLATMGGALLDRGVFVSGHGTDSCLGRPVYWRPCVERQTCHLHDNHVRGVRHCEEGQFRRRAFPRSRQGFRLGGEKGKGCEHTQVLLTNLLQKHWTWQEDRKGKPTHAAHKHNTMYMASLDIKTAF